MDPTPDSSLEAMRAERDAARRELADLRSWLTLKLGLTKRTPGPQGITMLSLATDREIVEKIEQLMAADAQSR